MPHASRESEGTGTGQAAVAVPASRRERRRAWLRDSGRRRVVAVTGVFVAAYAACVSFVLYLHGFLPGMSQMPLTSLMSTGAIQCLRNQGIESLSTWCMSLGLPVGAPRLTGLPQVYIGWFLTYVPGVDAWDAHQISSAAFVIAGFLASFALLRRWGSPRWVALLVTTSYMTAVNIDVLNGFEYTFLGYLLLPAYVWTALWVLDRIDTDRWVLAAAVAVALCLFMVFTEGYSFFGAGVVIACLVVAWMWRQGRTRWRRGVLAGGLWLSAAAGSALLYVAWAPEGAFETTADLEVFGLFGVDVTTLVLPRFPFGVFRLLGIGSERLALWGQSASIDYNYLGVLCLLLAGVLLAAIWRERRRRRAVEGLGDAGADDLYPVDRTDRAAEAEGADGDARPPARTGELLAVAVAGLVALVLSLGPVLKVGQTVPELSAALVRLPTAWMYENVPGLTEMRAVHRWLVVTRWCLLVLTAGGLTVLWRRWGAGMRRGSVVVLVGVLAVVEIAPDVPTISDVRDRSMARVTYVRDGVTAEADELIEPGEVILMLPASNDFFANYLVPMVGARSYNVGIDKNLALSSARWPENVLQAVRNYGPEAATSICLVLASDVDAVVLTYISPMRGALLVRDDSVADQERKDVALELAADVRFDAEVGEWLVVLRGGDPACLPAAQG